jgi:type II secretory pathway component PulF
MTVVATVQCLRLVPRLEQVYKELGIQLPASTAWALSPALHVIFLVILLTSIVLRHRQGWKAWATAIWVFVLLGYMTFCQAAWFEPLLSLMTTLGQQAQ